MQSDDSYLPVAGITTPIINVSMRPVADFVWFQKRTLKNMHVEACFSA